MHFFGNGYHALCIIFFWQKRLININQVVGDCQSCVPNGITLRPASVPSPPPRQRSQPAAPGHNMAQPNVSTLIHTTPCTAQHDRGPASTRAYIHYIHISSSTPGDCHTPNLVGTIAVVSHKHSVVHNSATMTSFIHC